MPNKISITWEDGSFGSRAAGIMVDGKKRVLLSRLEDEDVWVLPGGMISLYETSQETGKRDSWKKLDLRLRFIDFSG